MRDGCNGFPCLCQYRVQRCSPQTHLPLQFSNIVSIMKIPWYAQRSAESAPQAPLHLSPWSGSGSAAPFFRTIRGFRCSSAAAPFLIKYLIVIKWKLWKIWYWFTTSNLQRYEFIQVETRKGIIHLAFGTLPSVCVLKLKKNERKKLNLQRGTT